ncbi:unnamed protein product [Rhizophagus irregularis]|nr:unnamed protein product [Rhizophagus irregularis]
MEIDFGLELGFEEISAWNLDLERFWSGACKWRLVSVLKGEGNFGLEFVNGDRFRPRTWIWEGFRPRTWIWEGFRPRTWIWEGFWSGIFEFD